MIPCLSGVTLIGNDTIMVVFRWVIIPCISVTDALSSVLDECLITAYRLIVNRNLYFQLLHNLSETFSGQYFELKLWWDLWFFTKKKKNVWKNKSVWTDSLCFYLVLKQTKRNLILKRKFGSFLSKFFVIKQNSK